MTGFAMPWSTKLSGQQKEDQRNARELQQKQLELEKRQEKELEDRRLKLNKQQISMLRSRFGVTGGATGAAVGGGTSPQGMSDTASSLYARITGR